MEIKFSPTKKKMLQPPGLLETFCLLTLKPIVSSFYCSAAHCMQIYYSLQVGFHRRLDIKVSYLLQLPFNLETQCSSFYCLAAHCMQIYYSLQVEFHRRLDIKVSYIYIYIYIYIYTYIYIYFIKYIYIYMRQTS
jgi:hypothetical protein